MPRYQAATPWPVNRGIPRCAEVLLPSYNTWHKARQVAYPVVAPSLNQARRSGAVVCCGPRGGGVCSLSAATPAYTLLVSEQAPGRHAVEGGVQASGTWATRQWCGSGSQGRTMHSFRCMAELFVPGMGTSDAGERRGRGESGDIQVLHDANAVTSCYSTLRTSWATGWRGFRVGTVSQTCRSQTVCWVCSLAGFWRLLLRHVLRLAGWISVRCASCTVRLREWNNISHDRPRMSWPRG